MSRFKHRIPTPVVLRKYIGQTPDDVKHCHRVVEVNGKHLMVTRDYVPTRINLALEDGVIVSAYFG